MQFTYQTDTVILACEGFVNNYETKEDTPDCLDYMHILRAYETLLLAKTKPSSVLLEEYELSLLGEWM
jgi:hypothetical protein